MNAGTKGAGLSGGVAQEKLWREMLADMKAGFTDLPPAGSETAEADYYFNGYPLSHKTIGYKSKKPELALAHEIEAELKKEEEKRELTIAELLNVATDSQRRV
jgi:hypothetical protein